VGEAEALEGRFRRLENAIAWVKDGLNVRTAAEADALVPAMDAIYSLWEAWTNRMGLAWKDEDPWVRGDAGGETVAALVHAGGAQKHRLVEFGEYAGFGKMPFGKGPLGGACWIWQPYHDPDPRYAQRSQWYRTHVERRMANEPLEVAYRWLRSRPELQ
jgi:hypothetical protein